MCINAPEGCQRGTHTNETAYPLGTYASVHTQTHSSARQMRRIKYVSDAVTPTAASHEVGGPAPLRWPSGGMVAPNVEGKRRCVCSVDDEGSPKGNEHTGNGHPRRLQQPGCTGR
eukprot:scaffold13164_cov66-Phaeocystis_antarctica.AAC.4